jgi:hypothetical protein
MIIRMEAAPKVDSQAYNDPIPVHKIDSRQRRELGLPDDSPLQR